MKDVKASPEIKKSLEACWKEGIPAQVMISTLDYYLIPLGIFLGATTMQVGLLVSLPSLMAAASQFAAVRAVRLSGSRLKLIIYGVTLQALVLLPVGILPLLNIPQRVTSLIILIAIFRVVGGVLVPAWGSLVSDYLPESERGKFFGWRCRVIAISGVIAVLFWGVFLFVMKNFSLAWGFAIVFLGAAIARFLSFYFMTKMGDMPLSLHPQNDFTFWMFIRRARESNFVKFVFYLAGITFATQLSAPFFSVQMLEYLHFNYFAYMSVQLASVLAGLVAFPLWGRHADLTGNRKILKITGALVPFIPVLWLFGRGPVELILIEFFAGFLWSGFNLCSTNFIYDAVSPEKRVRVIGYFNLINGAAMFAGAFLGGFLAERLPALWGYRLLSLFLLSAVLRLLVHVFLFPLFQEVRLGTKKVSSSQLFLSVLGIRPVWGRDSEKPVFPL